MTKKMKELAREYRLPEISTSEDLECMRFKIADYGKRTIAVGYYFTHKGNCYYAAVYEHTNNDLTCEGEEKLIAVSEERFEDDGHALAWGFSVK